MRRLAFAALAAAFILMIGAPLSHIARWEQVLRSGKVFKFKVRPVDPYDAFSGRFVELNFAADTAPIPAHRFESREKVWCVLATDERGFAVIRSLSHLRPAAGDYVPGRIRYIHPTNTAYLDFPFDRYYMEEKSALMAERALGSRSLVSNVFAAVRVHRGAGTTEELFVKGEPVGQYLRKRPAKTGE